MSKKLAVKTKLDIQGLRIPSDISMPELSSLYTRVRDAQQKSLKRAEKAGRIPHEAVQQMTPMKLSAIKATDMFKQASAPYKRMMLINEIERMKRSNAQTRSMTKKKQKSTLDAVDEINSLGGEIGKNHKNPTETYNSLENIAKQAYQKATDFYSKGKTGGDDPRLTAEELQQKTEDYTARIIAPKATPNQRRAIIKKLKDLGVL